MKARMRGVDLFAGVGGFAYGMQQAGIAITRSFDYEADVIAVHKANLKRTGKYAHLLRVPPDFRKETYDPAAEFKRGSIHASRTGSHVADLLAVIDIAPEIALDRPDVIFGGPPCQAFASSGKKKGDNDARSRLTEAFAIIVATARPKYFVMENVKGLQKSETFRRAIAIFRASGYGLTQTVVNASHYNVPQGRERLIVAGCLAETDGWFSDYLHQYKSAQPMTVADVFGPDFGTPLGEFLLPENFDEYLDEETAARIKGRWFRERDRKRLEADHVDETTRFYHANPGGKGSARLHPIDRPAPTLIRTTMHELPSTYRPREGDPVDIRNVYQPTFEEFSRIGGFPEGWQWPDRIPKGARRTKEEMEAGERERYLMLANAVPPPLARAIGRAIVDHNAGRVPVAPVEAKAIEQRAWTITPRALTRYRRWLSVGKGKTPRQVTQAISDLRRAKSMVAIRGLAGAKEELEAFDMLPATKPGRMTRTRRSQLRRALLDLAEFEVYQDVVRDGGIFPNDDEAYGRGEFHAMLRPDTEIGPDENQSFITPGFLERLARSRITDTPAIAAELEDLDRPVDQTRATAATTGEEQD